MSGNQETTRRSFVKKGATVGLVTTGLIATTGTAAAASDYIVKGENTSNQEGEYAIEVGKPDSETLHISVDSDGDHNFISDSDKVIVDVINVPPSASNEEITIDNGAYVSILEEKNVDLTVYEA